MDEEKKESVQVILFVGRILFVLCMVVSFLMVNKTLFSYPWIAHVTLPDTASFELQTAQKYILHNTSWWLGTTVVSAVVMLLGSIIAFCKEE